MGGTEEATEVPNVNPLSLEGRTALITGAAHGIGSATARLFARAGANVAIVDRDSAGVTRTAEQIGLAGGEALPFTEDVTDGFAMERVIDRVVEDWGHLDILINNAGIVRDALLADVTDEDFNQILDVQLKGVMVCTRAATPHMISRGFGRILSAASTFVRHGLPGQTAHGASKAGVIGMTRVWARELGPKGITANAVAPGFIDTDIPRSLAAKEIAEIISHTPARRMGTADEVANVYLFLASDLASFMNGAVVGVDGGLLL